MADKEKDGNYALNTFEDIRKNDLIRMLDLGNDVQVLFSQNNPEINEESRAITNFEKLTEDRPRPIKHTLVDATRILPDIIALALGAGVKAAGKAAVKAVGKGVAKKTTKNVTKKLLSEGTSDAATALAHSKFLPRADKTRAAKKWVNDLYENTGVMERIAGKKLSNDEVEAIRKNIKELLPEKLDEYNKGVDQLKDVYEQINFVWPDDRFETREDLVRNLSSRFRLLERYEQKLGPEYTDLLKNLDSLPNYVTRPDYSKIPLESLVKTEKALSDPINVRRLLADTMGSRLNYVNVASKVAEAGLNDLPKTKFKTHSNLELKPNYWTRGSEPTPGLDFVMSLVGLDFDDPARFNKKDIDTFFEFLEDGGYIEQGVKDKWTPRQKVSVMREMLSDEVYGPVVKDRWAKSKHKENLRKYYSGE